MKGKKKKENRDSKSSPFSTAIDIKKDSVRTIRCFSDCTISTCPPKKKKKKKKKNIFTEISSLSFSSRDYLSLSILSARGAS